MNGIALACTALVGLINLLPVLGVLGGTRLESAYGISLNSAELEILLRHRALLFGLIGAFVIASLGLPQYRLPALLLAGASMVGFILIAFTTGTYGDEIGRIIRADIAGLVFLAGALIATAIDNAGRAAA